MNVAEMRTDRSRPLHPLGRFTALLSLAAFSPVLALAALAIKVSSRGPILFRASRIGLGGRPFTMYKFRTMHQRQTGAGARITPSEDVRVFLAGRWLRRFKIDELPQLANVIWGQMALVGPRPEDPSIVEEHYTPFMLETLRVLPGLTSPGSLAYYAAEASLPDDPFEAERVYIAELLPRKIALDLVYVRNRSWRYDAELVARTTASMVGLHGLFAGHRAWEQGEAERLLSAAVQSRRPGEAPR